MKIRAFAIFVVLGLACALAFGLLPSRGALASSLPQAQSTPVCQPNTESLASLCASFSPNNPGNPGPAGAAPGTSPEGNNTLTGSSAPQPHMFTLTDLEFGGAGGILAGLLIGLLVPAVRNAISGNMFGGAGNRSLTLTGKGIGNPDLMPDLDAGGAKMFKGRDSFMKMGQGSTGQSGAGGKGGTPTGQSGPGTGGGGGGSTGQSGPGTGGGGGMGESSSN